MFVEPKLVEPLRAVIGCVNFADCLQRIDPSKRSNSGLLFEIGIFRLT